ncbi:MAG: hypothetical protein ACTHKU_16565, partial [Verrucomicrobiota bacterium]
PHPGCPSLRNQAHDLIHTELHQLIRDLGLDPEFWKTQKVLTAPQAISAGIADSIVPTFSRQQENPSHKLNTSHETER